MTEKERRDWDLNSKGEEYLNTLYWIKNFCTYCIRSYVRR